MPPWTLLSACSDYGPEAPILGLCCAPEGRRLCRTTQTAGMDVFHPIQAAAQPSAVPACLLIYRGRCRCLSL